MKKTYTFGIKRLRLKLGPKILAMALLATLAISNARAQVQPVSLPVSPANPAGATPPLSIPGVTPAAANALPAPKAPVVKRAPSSASWTVQYSYAPPANAESSAPVATPASPSLPAQQGKASGNTDRLLTLTVTKSTRTYWEQSTWVSGKKSEKWIIDGIQLHILPGGTEVALVPKPEVEDPASPWFDYAGTDFPEFKGLSLQHYKGPVTYQGQPTYSFEWDRGGEKCLALLNERQLPLVLATARGMETFTFNAPPARLTPPEKFLKVFQTHKRGLQVLKRNPSPP